MKKYVICEGSTYVLCPGGNGKLPEITFNSASPKILYNDLSRHYILRERIFQCLRIKADTLFMLRRRYGI